MKAIENATTFFHNCETAKGWEACKNYAAQNAKFNAQSEPLADVTKLEDYVNLMQGIVTVTMPGCSYKVHSSAYDETNNTVIFFATFTGTHSGDGGPIPPSNKTMNTDYVYVIKMNHEDKVESLTKIWNSSWAFRELGWI